MEWPKRTRTADWENGVLTLDGEKKFDIPKLTAEIMERLAGYTLVGFHVKGYPVTDELLAPFAGHKSMVNFGVENGTLTDCWVSVKQFSKNDTATACQDWLRSTRLGRGSIKSHVRTVKVLGMGLFAFQERIHLWKGVTH